MTPVRNEVENIGRLADALAGQRIRPVAWMIVDTGSTDETPELVAAAAAEHDWIFPTTLEGAADLARGGPIARAFELGCASLEPKPDVIVKLDADTSFEPGYFERLLAEFESDARLGMASGTCHELESGEWRERHVTGSTVWGASRCYRRECLADVLPLEQRMGWDGVDEFRANARGWRTRTSRICRSTITGAKASGTERSTAHGSLRAAPPATSATGSGTSRCARSGMPGRSPLPSR